MMVAHYKLPADLAADIDAYAHEAGRFLAGSLPASVFRAGRVPRGVYEQRRDGSFMVRVRVAGGTLNADQARELAELSREFGDGQLHVTTRQDIQFHDVSIGDTPSIMRRLMAVGLTTRGGGGNTVRNVMACPYAGVCPTECFDVTPCAHAVTEYMLPLVGSYNLPRKYKLAFSGCGADCALAQVSDLGFVAEMRGGRPGFRVLAGGGMGAQSRLADVLLDWTPASEIIRVAETVRRLFDRLGNRANKHQARLRFVFNRIGAETFRGHFVALREEIVREGVPAWMGEITPVSGQDSGGRPEPPAVKLHDGVRIVYQRQENLVAVPLRLPLGTLPADDLARIGGLAARFSREEGLRITREQNLLIRSVPIESLAALAAGLRALRTDALTPTPLDNFVACAGASTCRLGLCLSRNAAQACATALGQAGLSRETLADMTFRMNGCANACGQQPVAAIGYYGVAQRVGARLIPSYGITLGGRCGADGARLGVLAGKIPAVALPAFTCELASDFEARRMPGEKFDAFHDRLGTAHFENLAARHAEISPRLAQNPNLFRDCGADEDFSLAGRGAGECGAGVFEVIQQDLTAARNAATPFEILLPTARALLITRGLDTQDADSVLRAFDSHFVETGLVAGEFRHLLVRARGFLLGWQTAFDGQDAAIRRLREQVEALYATLDANLLFHPPPPPPAARQPPLVAAPDASPPPLAADHARAELDLGGVPCPMNFVKTKLKLERLRIGDTLAIILDDGEPIRNVPASLKSEGQEVGEIRNLGDGRWRVIVKKTG